ncbi:hypothetical protein, partial [Burkholderia sp. Cy-637]|uniref:hypothetical protein n=1 Tax=Burkholderia sp. Cy-637 TaxID=2608327 RepID=UPI0019634BDE
MSVADSGAAISQPRRDRRATTRSGDASRRTSVRRLGEPGLAGFLAAARRADHARRIETRIDVLGMIHDSPRK